MRNFRMIFYCLMILALVVFLMPVRIMADEAPKTNESSFVDLDGDGFDDNLPDTDENGIPDNAESNSANATDNSDAQGLIAALTPINASGGFSMDQLLPNSEKFGKRKFSCRDQSCFRGGFDAGQDFGPGNGISSVAVSGGCAGGICH